MSTLTTSLLRMGNDNFVTCGFATLVNGSTTVNISALPGTASNYKIFVSHYNLSQQSGRLYVLTSGSYSQFVIQSTEINDQSTVSWFVVYESTNGLNTTPGFNRFCDSLLIRKNYTYGSAQLSGSEVTISTPFIAGNVPVILTIKTPSPTNQTPQVLYFISDIVDYTSFKIRSNQDNDTATISYLILYETENMSNIPGGPPSGVYTTFGLDAAPSVSGNSGNYGMGDYSSINAPTTIYTTRASNSMDCFFSNYNASSANNFVYPPYLSSTTVGQSFDVLQIDQQSFETSSFSWLLLP